MTKKIFLQLHWIKHLLQTIREKLPFLKDADGFMIVNDRRIN